MLRGRESVEPGGCTAFRSHSNINVLTHPAQVTFKLGLKDEAIGHMRFALAEAPELPSPPELAPVIRRVTAHRIVTEWLLERRGLGDKEEAERQLARSPPPRNPNKCLGFFGFVC